MNYVSPPSGPAYVNQSFGELLYLHRERKKLGQTQLAAQSKLSKSYVSGIENSKLSPPSPAAVNRLCTALRLTDAQTEEMQDAATRERERRITLPDSFPKHVRELIELFLLHADKITPALAGQMIEILLEETASSRGKVSPTWMVRPNARQ